MASFFTSAPSFILALETEVSCCWECLVIPVKPVSSLLEERVWVGCQGTFDLQHQTLFLLLPKCTKRPCNRAFSGKRIHSKSLAMGFFLLFSKYISLNYYTEINPRKPLNKPSSNYTYISICPRICTGE